MTETSDYTIIPAQWDKNREALCCVRDRVFVQEQQVPIELALDEYDMDAIHVLALNRQKQPIGTARLLQTGQLGRMSVLKEWRGKGIGAALLGTLLDIAETQGFKKLYLNAQVQAMRFYERVGFSVVGDVFYEAGIAHVRMECRLA